MVKLAAGKRVDARWRDAPQTVDRKEFTSQFTL
jgi:hypothetical protein